MRVFEYIESLFLFYLKGKVTIDNNNIKLEDPNTILKIIPLGRRTSVIPVTQLTSVEDNFSLQFKPFIAGLFTVLIGFTIISDSFLSGLIFLLLGAIAIINSFETILVFTTAAGKTYPLQFLVFEKSIALEIKEIVELIINQRLNDTNHRMVQETTNELLQQMLNQKEQ